jgi:hypothetical protein
MRLELGRVKDMVKQAMKKVSCIPCHETLSGDGAVCRGFFDRYKTQPLQIAERLGFIEFVAPSEEMRSQKIGHDHVKRLPWPVTIPRKLLIVNTEQADS